MQNTRQRLQHIAGIVTIIALAAAMGMFVTWRVPGLQAQAQDSLMRMRGLLAPPDDIVIIAIDEASIARFGRFPWTRSLMAQAIDRINAAQPRVITLNVLYSDTSNPSDDAALAAAVARAGNVVVAAQLVNEDTMTVARRAVWLKPLSVIEQAAGGVGHNGVMTDFDGVARAILLRQMDDEAKAHWALAVETVRVGDGTAETEVRDAGGGVRVGKRLIPVEAAAPTMIASAQQNESAQEIIRADRMTLDYLGPAGAFSAHTYSIADLLDGRIAPAELHGKYVLIGATAASLGERLASPFARQESADSDQHAQFMPGVEVLANSVNTILRARFHSAPPDWIAVLCAALIGASVLSVLTLAQGRGGLPMALAALTGLLALILIASYITYTHWLIVPPLVPMLVAFTTATPLTLLRRNLAASANLDERIAELTQAGSLIAPFLPTEAAAAQSETAAALIAQLTEASAVAIFVRRTSGPAKNDYQMISSYGEALVQTSAIDDNRFISLAQMSGGSVVEALMTDDAPLFSAAFSTIPAPALPQRVLTLRLGQADDPTGALVVACSAQQPPAPNTLRVCLEIAASQVAGMSSTANTRRSSLRWLRLPQGWAEKIGALARLQRTQIKRSLFVDRALHSGTDGLIIAGVDGQISFANPSAATIFNRSQQAMRRGNLFALISGNKATPELRAMLVRLLLERAAVEREIAMGEAPVKFYLLRLAAICEDETSTGSMSGIIATLSDITRQRELQQMKNDVMALVTHELRTPLTAIQGMSEVLAQYEMKPEEQHEMFRAINDEAKRLARMIEEYLDITRIEAGARRLHLTSVRVEKLLEGVLLTLRPVAAQRRISFISRIAPDLPALLVDSDLLTRAVTNLLSNAVKYSPAETEITIKAHADEQAFWIEIADQGYGIPTADRERIFEKFHRVARPEDADVRGTGLGLAFVREIAELHGGRITVESQVGSGSTFSLRLPLRKPMTATE